MTTTAPQSHTEPRNPLSRCDAYDAKLTATAWHRRLFLEPSRLPYADADDLLPYGADLHHMDDDEGDQ